MERNGKSFKGKLMIKNRKNFLYITFCIIVAFFFTSFIEIGGEIKFRYSSNLVLRTCVDSDLEKINKFYFLKKLNIQQLKSENLDMIANENLKELVIMTSTNNDAYMNLKKFSKLESFYSVGLDFNDLSYFSSMDKLKKLYLGFGYANNRIKSSDFFEKLPFSLEHVCFNGLENTEYLNFSELKNLETLYLSNSSLTSLYIDNSKLEGISLSNNSVISHLDISSNTINLKKIYIDDCPKLVLDIDELGKLESLQYIFINDDLLTEKEIQKLSNIGIEVDYEPYIRGSDNIEKKNG
ncbi:MAG: hypothetical protein PUE12_06585 [Oscillospiraceae bacterium]|nr:hypothetical protein [Oscillospiraceae bacterium]